MHEPMDVVNGARSEASAAVCLWLLQLAVEVGEIDRAKLLQARGAEMRPHMVLGQFLVALKGPARRPTVGVRACGAVGRLDCEPRPGRSAERMGCPLPEDVVQNVAAQTGGWSVPCKMSDKRRWR